MNRLASVAKHLVIHTTPKQATLSPSRVFSRLSTPNMPTYTGSCYCRNIQYNLTLSSPDDARTSLCHCHNCKVHAFYNPSSLYPKTKIWLFICWRECLLSRKRSAQITASHPKSPRTPYRSPRAHLKSMRPTMDPGWWFTASSAITAAVSFLNMAWEPRLPFTPPPRKEKYRVLILQLFFFC